MRGSTYDYHVKKIGLHCLLGDLANGVTSMHSPIAPIAENVIPMDCTANGGLFIIGVTAGE
jgi:hypothetical protein